VSRTREARAGIQILSKRAVAVTWAPALQRTAEEALRCVRGTRDQGQLPAFNAFSICGSSTAR